jgi:hypothetical protein
MSVRLVFKPYAAPGNVDALDNVLTIGAQNTNTGTHATDLTNAQTGLVAATFAVITYTDPGGATATQVINTSEVHSVR